VQVLDVARLFACIEDPGLPTVLPEAFLREEGLLVDELVQ
jgi:hypothetical protein